MSHSPEYSLKLASERRIDDRLPVGIDGEALQIGGSRLPVRFRDLSRQGAMFEADHHWRVGTRIWLFFPSGLAVNAKVVWANGRKHGCRFQQRLAEAELSLAQTPR
jgi:hypothetical protein